MQDIKLSDKTYKLEQDPYIYQLQDIENLLNDFNRELSVYRESFEFSEQDFYEVETRLNEINRLKSKYGNSAREILAYCEKQEEALEKLQNYDVYLEELKKKLD